MTVLLEQCPHCPAMLHPALVAAIRDARQPESCPARPKLENRVDARLNGELVPGELAAKRAVAYALLGRTEPRGLRTAGVTARV